MFRKTIGTILAAAAVFGLATLIYAEDDPAPPPTTERSHIAWQFDWDVTEEAESEGKDIDLGFADVLDIGDGLILVSDGRRNRLYSKDTGLLVKKFELPLEPINHDAAFVGSLVILDRSAKVKPEKDGDGWAEMHDKEEDVLEVWSTRTGQKVKTIGRDDVQGWLTFEDKLVLRSKKRIECWQLLPSPRMLWDRKTVIVITEKQDFVTVSVENYLIDLHLTPEGVYGSFDPQFTPELPMLRWDWKGRDETRLAPIPPKLEQYVWETAGPDVLCMSNFNQGRPGRSESPQGSPPATGSRGDGAPWHAKGWSIPERRELYDRDLPELNGFGARRTENPWASEGDVYTDGCPWAEHGFYVPFIENHGQSVPAVREARIFDKRNGRVVHGMRVWESGVYQRPDGGCQWLEDAEAGWSLVIFDGAGNRQVRGTWPKERGPEWQVFSDGRAICGVRQDRGSNSFQILHVDPDKGRLEVLLQRPIAQEHNEEGARDLHVKGVLKDGTVVVVESKATEGGGQADSRVYGLRP